MKTVNENENSLVCDDVVLCPFEYEREREEQFAFNKMYKGILVEFIG
jgi:hypothetical protein